MILVLERHSYYLVCTVRRAINNLIIIVKCVCVIFDKIASLIFCITREGGREGGGREGGGGREEVKGPPPPHPGGGRAPSIYIAMTLSASA